MSVQSRINSSQSASPYALDPHFIRQLRNFMNNWIVEGGNFHFDGYRARLRIDRQKGVIKSHQWKLSIITRGSPAVKGVGIAGGTVYDSTPQRNLATWYCNHVTTGSPASGLWVVSSESTIFYLKIVTTNVVGEEDTASWPIVEIEVISEGYVGPDLEAIADGSTSQPMNTYTFKENETDGSLKTQYIPIGWAVADEPSGDDPWVPRRVGNFLQGSLMYNGEYTLGGGGEGGDLPEGINGDLLVNIDGTWTPYNIGTDGQVLKVVDQGEGVLIPEWVDSMDMDGFMLYLSGRTPVFVPMDTAMSGYDKETDSNWSLEFSVTSSKLDIVDLVATPTNPIGVNSPTALYDGDAETSTAQTYYRIPIIRGGKRVSHGGAYRENIFCSGSRGPIVELVRI